MDPFLVIPAIDLQNGRCVRLRQGRAEDSTVFSDDPVAMARRWEAEGARYLHVVDFDGAFQGRPVHAGLIAQIVRAIAIPVQTGGGIRTDADIETLLAAGVARVILGTRAWAEPGRLGELARHHGERLAVGIDARDGLVQIKGWTETTGQTAADLVEAADRAGARTIIYTDTATDGMLTGPNVRGVESLCRRVGCRVIASGGVASAQDIRALQALALPNLAGAIVGKALYVGKVRLAEFPAE